MNLVLPLISGLLSAAIGIALPGLINMTAAKVSIRDGREKALLFVFGALIIIVFQTFLAILFARFIDARPDVVVVLREIGFAIFTVLTFYFLIWAKKNKFKTDQTKMHSKTNRFFTGILLSSLNFFPIPYYVFITVFLSSLGVFSFEKIPVVLFLVGVLLGSFSVFYYYICFFKKIESKTDFFIKNMNKIIGSITGIIALITLINILKYYCENQI